LNYRDLCINRCLLTFNAQVTNVQLEFNTQRFNPQISSNKNVRLTPVVDVAISSSGSVDFPNLVTVWLPFSYIKFLFVPDIKKCSTSALFGITRPFHQAPCEALSSHVWMLNCLTFFFINFVSCNRIFISSFYKPIVQVIAFKLMVFLGVLLVPLSLSLSLSLPHPSGRCLALR
jgi:hypothetical protein